LGRNETVIKMQSEHEAALARHKPTLTNIMLRALRFPSNRRDPQRHKVITHMRKMLGGIFALFMNPQEAGQLQS
jgi:hypothetical protein